MTIAKSEMSVSVVRAFTPDFFSLDQELSPSYTADVLQQANWFHPPRHFPLPLVWSHLVDAAKGLLVGCRFARREGSSL